MKLRDLIAHLSVRASGGDLDAEVTTVTRDTRDAGVGRLLVAVRGGRVDAHDLVGSVSGGFAGVLLERDVAVPAPTGWAEVEDTKRALAEAAAAVEGWPARRQPMIGVTGTNGKTTITTLIQQAVQATGGVAGRIGTTGVQVGEVTLPSGLTTPEAPVVQRWLREMADAGAEIVAMEVSSIGLVQQRVRAIPFAVGVFTNLGHDHLDFHGTMEAYAEAKALLFTEHLRAPGGAPRALLCGDDPAWPSMRPPADRWRYGFEADNDVRVLSAELVGDAMRLEIDLAGARVALRAPLVGRFNALNVTAALAAGVLAGIDRDRMVAGLAHATGAPGRLERVANTRGLTVLVDYAHTPDALEAALTSVAAAVPGRVWVVFGCGGDRDRTKRPVMGGVANRLADYAIVTSDNPRREDPQAIMDEIGSGMPHRERVEFQVDREKAIARAVEVARPGDLLLVAGKGHEIYQEFSHTMAPFDDREVLKKYLHG